MIHRDYIMRLVDLCAKALARVMNMPQPQEQQQALEDIRSTLAQAVSVSPDLLDSMTEMDLIILLRKSEWTAELFDSVGELLLQQGRILKSENKEMEAARVFRKAWLCFYEASLNVGDFQSRSEKMDFCITHDILYAGNPGYYQTVLEWLTRAGRYEKGEDWLFDMAEAGIAADSDAEKFFGWLKLMPDDVLEKSGMPRDEVISSQETYDLKFKRV